MPNVNSKAPDFSLNGIDNQGNEIYITLSELLNQGRNLVIYFYPRDNTLGCSQEACDFRDNFNRLSPLATVIGISADDVKSHKKFNEKNSINFILLSDPDHSTIEKYDAWGKKSMYGKTYEGIIRTSYIIDRDGMIIKAWKNVKVKGHVDAVIKELEYLN